MKNKEKLEQLQKEGCYYNVPDEDTGESKNCGQKQFMSVSLPLMKKMENGDLEPEGGEGSMLQTPVPACDYHAILFMSGLFHCEHVMDHEGMMRIQGPYKMVAVCEAVFNAKQMADEAAKQEEELIE